MQEIELPVRNPIQRHELTIELPAHPARKKLQRAFQLFSRKFQTVAEYLLHGSTRKTHHKATCQHGSPAGLDVHRCVFVCTGVELA